MLIDPRDLISAYVIRPEPKTLYRVVWVPKPYENDLREGAELLQVGDSVFMSETPDYHNVFIRPSDMSIHPIRGEDGYVLVMRMPPETQDITPAPGTVEEWVAATHTSTLFVTSSPFTL